MADSHQEFVRLISGERRGIAASAMRAGLVLASMPYSWCMMVRNNLYDWHWLPQHRASVPVVVVGNLTAGGTGKTPAVEYVSRFYRRQNRQVAILSRGYGSQDGRNDEALVLEANLDDVPHLQGADRLSLAQTAVEELERDLLVLDDGFQHRRLARDLDVVLVDATQPWGYGWCLPRGLLREGPSSLRRAGAIIVTRSDQVDQRQLENLLRNIERLAPGCPIAQSKHAPTVLQNTQAEMELAQLQGRPVATVCGIGNPQAFLATLRGLGADVIDQKIYPDHFAYQRRDVADIQAWARQLPEEAWLVTTQKDWVKLRIDQLGNRPLWSLRIALEITEGEHILQVALLKVIQPANASVVDFSLVTQSDTVSAVPLA